MKTVFRPLWVMVHLVYLNNINIGTNIRGNLILVGLTSFCQWLIIVIQHCMGHPS